MFFQLLIAGLANGSIYGMVGLAITVIFKSTTVVNFASGELLMICAFVFYTFAVLMKLSFIISFFLTAFIFAIALGLLMERVAFRSLTPHGHLMVVMGTLAVGIAFKGIARLIWGSDILTVPSMFDFKPMVIRLGSANFVISSDNIAIIIFSLIVMLVFFLVFQYSKLGKKMRATSSNELGAMLVGINVKNIYGTVWATGTVIYGIAGILFVPISTLHIEMGTKLMLKGFAACLVGGFGNLFGAMVGGVSMGIIETIFGGYVSTSMMDISSLMAIAFVLVFKPQGLFGKKGPVKV